MFSKYIPLVLTFDLSEVEDGLGLLRHLQWLQDGDGQAQQPQFDGNGVKGRVGATDVAELVDMLSDADDAILERVSMNLDEAAGQTIFKSVFLYLRVLYPGEMRYWKYPRLMLLYLGLE